MEVIAIINQKGGVGKTTTAQALGAGLMQRGFKVLFIDLDSQQNLSYSTGATVDQNSYSSIDLLTGRATAGTAPHKTPQGDIIPASGSLAGADTIIKGERKEYRVKEALQPISNYYDYIIIDTPPALGIITINALTACNSVIITTQADIYSLQGIGQLSQTIGAVKKYCNNNLSIKGLLLTRYNGRATLSKDMLQLLEDTAETLDTKVFNTKIRECISLKEAQAVKKNIFAYAPRSNAAKDYKAFIEEFLKQ